MISTHANWTTFSDRPPVDGKYWVTIINMEGEREVLAMHLCKDMIAGIEKAGQKLIAWMPYTPPSPFHPAFVQTFRCDGSKKRIHTVSTEKELEEVLERERLSRFPEPDVTYI